MWTPWIGSSHHETFEVHVDPGLFRCPFCHFVFYYLSQYCYFQKALRTHDPVKALMAVPLCFCVFNAVTGSCFFIFSSALKASAGYLAKSSIVEGRMPAQRCRVPLLNLLPHSHLLPAANALKRFNLTSCRRMIKVPVLTLVHSACVDLCMCVSV